MSAQTTLIGNTTADIELRYSQAGKPVGNLTVAVSDRKFDRQSNEWVDGDTWFARCVIFGEMAEHAAASIHRGTRVIASGKVVQREWQDKEGQKRVSVEVILDEIGPSLRKATAQVARTASAGAPAGGSRPQQASEPWAAPSGAETGAQQWGGGSYGEDTPF